MDIWHTAAPDTYESRGWVADYLMSTTIDDDNPIFAASVTGGLNKAMYAPGVTVPAIASLPAYQYRTDARYPADRAGQLGYVGWAYGQDYAARPLEQYVASTGTNALVS